MRKRVLKHPRSARLLVGLTAFALAATGQAAPASTLPAETESWMRLRTPHLELLGNAAPHRIRLIARELETLRDLLRGDGAEPGPAGAPEAVIYVFRDEDTFARYVGRPSSDGGTMRHRGQFVPGRGESLLALDVSGLGYAGVANHELLHHVTALEWPALPLWLHEGLAEYYSTFDVQEGAARIGAPVEEHLDWLTREPHLPLAELFAVDPEHPTYTGGERQQTFYAQSWALTHMLMNRAEPPNGFGRLVAALESGASSAAALRDVYGLELPTVEQALREYVRRTTWQVLRRDVVATTDAGEVGPIARADLLYRLGELALHHGEDRFDLAEEHLRAAVAADAEHARAHAALGELLLKRSDDAGTRAGEAAFERAIALAPGDPAIRVRYAWALIEPAVFGSRDDLDGGTPAGLSRARGILAPALELAPKDPAVLEAYGVTHLFDRDGLGPAISALAIAVREKPQPLAELALVLLTARSGNLEGAEALLARSPRLRAREDQLASIEGELANAAVARAKEAIPEGAAARDVIAQRLARTVTPEVRDYLSGILSRMSVTDRMNEAVGLANAGKHGEAAAVAREVLAGEIDEEQRRRVQEFLSSLEAARGR